jgi:hypothetical protein
MLKHVRGVNRVTALVLALVWLCAGVVAVVLGGLHARWLLAACGVFAIGYAVLWLRVVARSRPLSWRDIGAPWRSGQARGSSIEEIP